MEREKKVILLVIKKRFLAKYWFEKIMVKTSSTSKMNFLASLGDRLRGKVLFSVNLFAAMSERQS